MRPNWAELRGHRSTLQASRFPAKDWLCLRGLTSSVKYLHTPRGSSELKQSLCTRQYQSSVQDLLDAPLPELMCTAAAARDAGHSIVTFSPKVFLPLTRLCRDSCGYCTFAVPPALGRRAYMSLEEVVQVAVSGAEQGCAEALFTLGDKPELLYSEARQELADMGFASTLDYVAEACQAVTKATGMLPHVNAGVMGLDDVLRLRAVSGSQGLMLETASPRLLARGLPHYNCPDKEPQARLDTIRAAGQARVPYTSGILVGIGETRVERIEALLQLKQLHSDFGHIQKHEPRALQELIIQNFQPKKGTAMADLAEPPLEELLWTIAVARILFGPGMNIQAPPNLTPEKSDGGGWHSLLAAGINDWGGVSPVTRDFVNPEKAWPHLQVLADATAATGKPLVPRLTLYPDYALNAEKWLDSSHGRGSMSAAVLRQSDSQGLLRSNPWSAGAVNTASRDFQSGNTAVEASAPEAGSDAGHKVSSSRGHRRRGGAWATRVGEDGLLDVSQRPAARSQVAALLDQVVNHGHELAEDEIVYLFEARGTDFDAVCAAADAVRHRLKGDTVTYGVVRNINYTNVCTYGCGFCAFSKGRLAEDLRGAPYLLPLDEISRRTREAWDRGASEVCMQGGIHPDFTGATYLRILEAAKDAAPGMHVHAFSPLEVSQGASTLGWPIRRYLRALRDAGLGSLPGTAAEVLDDGVRRVLCPDKLSTSEWLEVIEAAHEVGLMTSSTIMFGHCDSPRSWARHMLALRSLQSRTWGFTEFVPLPFVHMEAPIYLKGKARKGPTLRECYLMHSISRLTLMNYIDNIQASWVKMGPERAVSLMNAGCNDMGGTLMNESITKAAGAAHGQELPPERMEALIRAAGRLPRQRTTSYSGVMPSQTRKSFGAAPLAPLNMKQFELAQA